MVSRPESGLDLLGVFTLFFKVQMLQGTTSAQVQPSEEEEEDTVAWVNAALGRVFWDFLSEPYWAELVSKKIQMKLSKIRVSGARSPISFRSKSG